MLGQYKLDPKDWSIRDWKNVAWESVKPDSLICPSPAFVFSLAIMCNGSGEGDARVFDATSLQGTGKYVQLYCVDEDMNSLNFWPPLYFHQGIYLDEGTNVDRVLIQYLPWRD